MKLHNCWVKATFIAWKYVLAWIAWKWEVVREEVIVKISTSCRFLQFGRNLDDGDNMVASILVDHERKSDGNFSISVFAILLYVVRSFLKQQYGQYYVDDWNSNMMSGPPSQPTAYTLRLSLIRCSSQKINFSEGCWTIAWTI